METQAYFKKKGLAALKKAKELEASKKATGADYVKVNDKTFALRS
ncbi:hypothetical protein PL371_09945 [Tenacibaculum maritimum]|nr:hypothetical protein [Tenacibaculum maritimum]MDB0612184.1 hypothetical protein [Tenacibaculum maritimum]